MKATEKIINSTILSVEGLAVGCTEVIIVTSNGTYKMYHCLTEINGIKSDMCPYTEAVKRYNFPKPKAT